MLSREDVLDILAIDLIGIVPDDEAIIVSTNRGTPAAMHNHSPAGTAYRQIARRIMGEDVPILTPESQTGFMARFSRWLRGE